MKNGSARASAPRPLAPRGSLRPEDFTALQAIGLTPRECEVLGWVAQGNRDAEIGAILGIATKTVGKHLEHLLAKLRAETRTAAVSIAQRRLRSRRNDGRKRREYFP